MKKHRSLKTLFSSLFILMAILGLTGAVTYSVLQSQQAVLASNTISSATAALMVSTDSTTYNNTKSGFTFNNVVPGGPAVPSAGNPVYLKNQGTANLSIRASISSTPTNLNNVDLSKVYLHIAKTDNSFDQSFSIKSLMDSYATGGTIIGDVINASTITQYQLRVSMTSDAFNGTNGVTISGVDLVFTGVAN